MAGWQYALVRHPIRPALRWEPYRTVCGFGMRLSGAHLLDYVGSNLDTFTVGRFASTAVLGQYTRAYYVVFQPLGNYVAQALTSVLFANLSRIQHELGTPAPCLSQPALARRRRPVPRLRRRGGGRTGARAGRARPAMGPGRRDGAVVRPRRRLQRPLEALPVAWRRSAPS